MMNEYSIQHPETNPILSPVARIRFQKKMTALIFLLYFTTLGILFYVMSGCSGPSSHRLPAHFESEPQSSKILHGKLSAHTQDRLPVGLAIVVHGESSPGSLAFTEDSWPQFAARVKQKVQNLMPVSMQEVIRIDAIPAGEKASLIQGMGGNRPVEVILVALPSNQEVRGPAQFDVLPEVGTLNGHHTENHATVELGFLDVNSGKLLLQAQGASYAMLDQLDVPLTSSRYPRVRGSAMTSAIYPEEEKALETVRMIALNEALDQAIMKLAQKWTDGVGAPVPSGSLSLTGVTP